MMPKKQYLTTSDSIKASYLIAMGNRLVTVQQNNSDVTFIFDDTEALQDDLRQLKLGSAEVVLIEYIEAQKELEASISQNLLNGGRN